MIILTIRITKSTKITILLSVRNNDLNDNDFYIITKDN